MGLKDVTKMLSGVPSQLRRYSKVQFRTHFLQPVNSKTLFPGNRGSTPFPLVGAPLGPAAHASAGVWWAVIGLTAMLRDHVNQTLTSISVSSLPGPGHGALDSDIRLNTWSRERLRGDARYTCIPPHLTVRVGQEHQFELWAE